LLESLPSAPEKPVTHLDREIFVDPSALESAEPGLSNGR
jgi:hypothetical protein